MSNLSGYCGSCGKEAGWFNDIWQHWNSDCPNRENIPVINVTRKELDQIKALAGVNIFDYTEPIEIYELSTIHHN